jgi:MoxR-like ATPase
LARQVAAAVQALRELDLYKPPGVAETIDWANALAALGRTEIDERAVGVTLGTILKYREDQERTRAHGLDHLVQSAMEHRA